MIHEWLGPSLTSFLTQQYRRVPFAQPGSAQSAVPLLTWDILDEVLQSRPAPDLLVVRNGRLLDIPAPTRSAQVKELFLDGTGIVIRKAERQHAGLRALADDVAREMQGTVTLQLFVTPKGHFSFGWHYDAEEVFIVQNLGAKEYLLRQNTVNPRPRPDAMPRDMQFEKERTPVHTCTLLAGDWLHIPSGWWHMANCMEDALSISIGILPR